MRVYLASPANQMQADCMAGQHVLESFALAATAPWMARYRATFASAMLDSGAYSVMASGKSVDLGAYVAFALERRAAYAEVVNLDVISGDVGERVRASQRNLDAMRAAGLDPMPVFHQGEPWTVLEELASCGKVGLGFQRPIREPERFLDGCFSRLPAGTKVHGFAMANVRYAGRYPFASVDGATWLHELRALMAAEGQGADVLRCLTPAELLRLVVKKYERMPAVDAWQGKAQGLLDL